MDTVSYEQVGGDAKSRISLPEEEGDSSRVKGTKPYVAQTPANIYLAARNEEASD